LPASQVMVQVKGFVLQIDVCPVLVSLTYGGKWSKEQSEIWGETFAEVTMRRDTKSSALCAK
jgi:hypothetical protein